MSAAKERRMQKRRQVMFRCEVDGQFFSERTADQHRVCAMIVAERDSGYRG